MKKLQSLFFIICIGCSPMNNKDIHTSEEWKILNIDEYQNVFCFKASNERKDTVMIISYKDEYYIKQNYEKPILKNQHEIQLNRKYHFILSQKKPSVSTMQQLGAFIVIEEDTLWKSSDYKNIPKFYISHNTIGKYY